MPKPLKKNANPSDGTHKQNQCGAGMVWDLVAFVYGMREATPDARKLMTAWSAFAPVN
jgi:hypothetical protein